MRFLEVNLIGMARGIWQWQVRDNQKVISYGYATAREVARFGGYRDLFFLLSLGRPAGGEATSVGGLFYPTSSTRPWPPHRLQGRPWRRLLDFRLKNQPPLARSFGSRRAAAGSGINPQRRYSA
jgi:hypothetical protein